MKDIHTIPVKYPRIVEHLSEEDYAKSPGYRSSQLKQIMKSPMHFQFYDKQVKTQTAAMQTGTALHAALLEPEQFHQQYVVVPKIDKRTSDGKARWNGFLAKHQDKMLIQADDLHFVESLHKALKAHPYASKLFSLPSKSELSIYWEDPLTGLPLKARLDLFLQLPQLLYVELKTTSNAGKDEFRRRIAQFEYHFSIAMYQEGIKRVFGENSSLVFLVVEDVTYQVCLYTPDDEMLDVGRKRFRFAVDLLAKCLEKNYWPGYQDTLLVEDISLPPWATRVAQIDYSRQH